MWLLDLSSTKIKLSSNIKNLKSIFDNAPLLTFDKHVLERSGLCIQHMLLFGFFDCDHIDSPQYMNYTKPLMVMIMIRGEECKIGYLRFNFHQSLQISVIHREYSNPDWVADQAGAEALGDGGHGGHGGAVKQGLGCDVNDKAIEMELIYLSADT